jgi:GNAT superfamily N-acetyltransferase
MRICHLIDVPALRAELEQWFVEEWAPWYGPGGQGDAKADLVACGSRDTLPICLVALSDEGELLGTAAIKEDSVGSELGVGPWLAAMLVKREYRGRGVGTALVEAIEAEAARIGFEEIYSSTDTAMKILERRGWKMFGSARSLRGEIAVYQRAFKNEPQAK